MAKRKFYATTQVAKEVSFGFVNEVANAAFKVINVTVKSYKGDEPEKIKTPSAEQLSDEDTRVFVMFRVEGHTTNIVMDMAILNKYGFLNVIDIAADNSFTVHDGATVSYTGETLEFNH